MIWFFQLSFDGNYFPTIFRIAVYVDFHQFSFCWGKMSFPLRREKFETIFLYVYSKIPVETKRDKPELNIKNGWMDVKLGVTFWLSSDAYKFTMSQILDF